MQTRIYPRTVENSLKELKKGDHVSVLWLDASESGDVPLIKAVHNHSVESIVTSAGMFLGVQKGKAYPDLHFLIVKDYLDSEKMRVQSIPLSLVKSIHVFREKKKLLMRRDESRKMIIHFKDGSVKYIGGL